MSEPTEIVFVVEDDASVRRALGGLVRLAGLTVQTFPSAQEFLAFSRPDVPSCLVLDVQLPGLSGLDLQEELAKTDVQIPIIFLTGHGDIPMTVRAMKAGALEFLTKPFHNEDLLEAIRVAINRDRLARQERENMRTLYHRYNSLTPREQEVMKWVVAGLLNKQIAAELGISEIMIKVHRGQIMHKMQAESLADLVRMSEKLALSRAKKS
jgi:FixJ family two-component response regulator